MLEKVNIISSEAASKMKRAVFENYKLFIKAGKAASQLENTMHQIHNEFTEKQRVMNTLTELSLFNGKMFFSKLLVFLYVHCTR